MADTSFLFLAIVVQRQTTKTTVTMDPTTVSIYPLTHDEQLVLDSSLEGSRTPALPQTMTAFLKFKANGFVYEEFFLHCDALQELHPLQISTNTHDIAQILFDVLQVHKRLYDNSKILHGDISMGNIMFRFDSQNKVYGILNDFDLDPVDGTATSPRRIGTLPFIALDLQRRTPVSHIYRHDLESLFYVACVFVVRHELKPMVPPGKMNFRTEEICSIQSRSTPHLQTWFNPMATGQALAKDKLYFFQNMPENDVVSMVSPSLRDLGLCVSQLRLLFVNGFLAESTALMPRSLFLPTDATPQQSFDSHTLGGFVTYQLFETVMLGTSSRALRKRFRNPLQTQRPY